VQWMDASHQYRRGKGFGFLPPARCASCCRGVTEEPPGYFPCRRIMSICIDSELPPLRLSRKRLISEDSGVGLIGLQVPTTTIAPWSSRRGLPLGFPAAGGERPLCLADSGRLHPQFARPSACEYRRPAALQAWRAGVELDQLPGFSRGGRTCKCRTSRSRPPLENPGS